MSKNRHCPYFRNCWDDCSDCEHSIRYNKLHEKVRRRDKKIEKLENEWVGIFNNDMIAGIDYIEIPGMEGMW